MRLFALSGRTAAALRQYAECQRVLEDEIGRDDPGRKLPEMFFFLKSLEKNMGVEIFPSFFLSSLFLSSLFLSLPLSFSFSPCRPAKKKKEAHPPTIET